MSTGIAKSAVAMGTELKITNELLDKWNGDCAELYSELGRYAIRSNKIAYAVYETGLSPGGTWLYDVDEEFGKEFRNYILTELNEEYGYTEDHRKALFGSLRAIIYDHVMKGLTNGGEILRAKAKLEQIFKEEFE